MGDRWRSVGDRKQAHNLGEAGGSYAQADSRPLKRDAPGSSISVYEASAREHLAELLDRPFKIIAFDHQRRRHADHVVVRFFAEESSVFELFAIGPGQAVQLDADQ